MTRRWRLADDESGGHSSRERFPREPKRWKLSNALQSQRVFRTLKCRCSAARSIIALEAQGFDTRRYDSRKKAGCLHAAVGAEPILQFIWGSK